MSDFVLVCAATYNNLGLAASSIGQIDLAFRCLQFGLNLAEDDEEIEMIWYNIGNVAMQIGLTVRLFEEFYLLFR